MGQTSRLTARWPPHRQNLRPIATAFLALFIGALLLADAPVCASAGIIDRPESDDNLNNTDNISASPMADLPATSPLTRLQTGRTARIDDDEPSAAKSPAARQRSDEENAVGKSEDDYRTPAPKAVVAVAAGNSMTDASEIASPSSNSNALNAVRHSSTEPAIRTTKRLQIDRELIRINAPVAPPSIASSALQSSLSLPRDIDNAMNAVETTTASRSSSAVTVTLRSATTYQPIDTSINEVQNRTSDSARPTAMPRQSKLHDPSGMPVPNPMNINKELMDWVSVMEHHDLSNSILAKDPSTTDDAVQTEAMDLDEYDTTAVSSVRRPNQTTASPVHRNADTTPSADDEPEASTSVNNRRHPPEDDDSASTTTAPNAGATDSPDFTDEPNDVPTTTESPDGPASAFTTEADMRFEQPTTQPPAIESTKTPPLPTTTDTITTGHRTTTVAAVDYDDVASTSAAQSADDLNTATTATTPSPIITSTLPATSTFVSDDTMRTTSSPTTVEPAANQASSSSIVPETATIPTTTAVAGSETDNAITSSIIAIATTEMPDANRIDWQPATTATLAALTPVPSEPATTPTTPSTPRRTPAATQHSSGSSSSAESSNEINDSTESLNITGLIESDSRHMNISQPHTDSDDNGELPPTLTSTTSSSVAPTLPSLSVAGGGDSAATSVEFADGKRIDEPPPDDGEVAGVVAIAVSVTGVVLLLGLGLLYVMRKRQKQLSYSQRCRPIGLDAYSLDNMSSFRRKGGLQQSKRAYGNAAFDDQALKNRPLDAAGLAAFVTHRQEIYEEFKALPTVTAHIEDVPAGCEEKNRFANIVPLPETRCSLTTLGDDVRSEYINANYVKGPQDKTNYYIATQAPLENTVADFWRLVWEQNSRVILMATDLIEDGVERCTEYLPSSVVLDNQLTFGDFHVELKSREVRDRYAVSVLHLRNTATDTWRECVHVWYQWPVATATGAAMPGGAPTGDEAHIVAMLLDLRVFLKRAPVGTDSGVVLNNNNTSAAPSNGISALRKSLRKSLRRMVGKERASPADAESGGSVETVTAGSGELKVPSVETATKSRSLTRIQGPLTVHCSSGTGRTGTLIACDIAMRTLEQPGRLVDIPNVVHFVRNGRAGAVATREQYEFVYRLANAYATQMKADA